MTLSMILMVGVYDSAKILIWKQITTVGSLVYWKFWCIWLCKDTNLKANHNGMPFFKKMPEGVYDSAKILIWKQITTFSIESHTGLWCIWLCKDTNLKANHNCRKLIHVQRYGVYDSAKILIWKQITTMLNVRVQLLKVYMTLQRY